MRKASCACGAVRLTVSGDPLWVAHCHCGDCRKVTASPFTTYAGYAEGEVEITGEVKCFPSSAGVERGFCPACGTPVYFKGLRWPGEIHLFVGTFADAGSYSPTAHVYVKERLSFIHLGDGLKQLETTSG